MEWAFQLPPPAAPATPREDRSGEGEPASPVADQMATGLAGGSGHSGAQPKRFGAWTAMGRLLAVLLIVGVPAGILVRRRRGRV